MAQAGNAIAKPAEAEFARARADEDFLRHAMAGDFGALEPRAGEENTLAEQRALCWSIASDS